MLRDAITEDTRWRALLEAEARALDLLSAIEAAGFIAPGRREGDVDRDIAELAERASAFPGIGTSALSGAG